MVTLKVVLESGVDDLSSIETNIGALANKFLNPIDRVRSVARPAPTQNQTNQNAAAGQNDLELTARNNFEGIQVNPSRAMESRTNAFLRTLGFPVMDASGNFYNPGHDPDSANTLTKRKNIDRALLSNDSLQVMINLREIQVEERRIIFAAQDLSSTAYTLALRHVKPFLAMDRSIGPMEVDSQFFEVAERGDELFEITFNNPDVNTSFEGGQHILKPLVVDPRIDSTVMPDQNRICVPFLPTLQDTQISTDKKLLRPAIEYILRQRLLDSGLDQQFFAEAERLTAGNEEQEATAETIRDTVLAVTGEDSDILDQLQGFTTTQTGTLATLVKTIKSVIEQLDTIIADLDDDIIKLNLQPVPGVEGPEDATGFIRTSGGVKSPSSLDSRIARLKLEQQLELIRNKLAADDISDGRSDVSSLFAMPVIAVVQKDFNGDIQKLERERDSIGDKALENIANIERITGEVSGLGLIDVLAIYTALWAIDIETLLGFLDDEAFNRLYQNRELRTPAVESRNTGGGRNGLLVMTDFENKLFNILSFVDKLLTQAREDPRRADGGDATQG